MSSKCQMVDISVGNPLKDMFVLQRTTQRHVTLINWSYLCWKYNAFAIHLLLYYYLSCLSFPATLFTVQKALTKKVMALEMSSHTRRRLKRKTN